MELETSIDMIFITCMNLYLCHFKKYGSRDWALLLFANYLYSAMSEVLQRAVTYCPHAEILWLMAPWNV